MPRTANAGGRLLFSLTGGALGAHLVGRRRRHVLVACPGRGYLGLGLLGILGGLLLEPRGGAPTGRVPLLPDLSRDLTAAQSDAQAAPQPHGPDYCAPD